MQMGIEQNGSGGNGNGNGNGQGKGKGNGNGNGKVVMSSTTGIAAATATATAASNESSRKRNNKRNTSSSSNRRQQQNPKRVGVGVGVVSPVQRLYETCKLVFADCGPAVVPSPHNVQLLASLLDGMTQVDVGLRPNMPFFSSDRAPVITYLHLHECDKFSIGIFCLPPTSVIPLHNHPGMTVFSKLLFGTMHIKSYDWSNEVDKNDITTTANASALESPHDGLRLAKLKVNSEFTAPCRTSILYPADGGNMHCFTARTACAVLDVLGPPYCDPEGRHCQYYSEFPFDKFPVEGGPLPVDVVEEEKEGYYDAWLKEREKPEDLCVVGVPYNGPKIYSKNIISYTMET